MGDKLIFLTCLVYVSSMKELVARHAKILKINSKAAEPSWMSNGSRVFRILSHRNWKSAPKKSLGFVFASKNLHHFQTQVCFKLGKCNHLCISFVSFPSPFQYQRKKTKNASTTFFCHTPRRFVKWMLQQEEIRSRRNPPCQPQPTVHQTNWLIRWANSWCRCAKKSPVPKTWPKWNKYTNTYKYIQDLDGFGGNRF